MDRCCYLLLFSSCIHASISPSFFLILSRSITREKCLLFLLSIYRCIVNTEAAEPATMATFSCTKRKKMHDRSRCVREQGITPFL
ncbi:hypothetical protein DAI22_05g133301 [Oryza sativa Japonica Group]|nr:hypothetical protein DAI22_05g133301 [Oryza sativa Japonica Group]